jgi:membrane protease YdiL (CAAX protease family)
MEVIPDYKEYNLDTLYKLLEITDRDRFPERIDRIVRQIKKLESSSIFSGSFKTSRRLRVALLTQEDKNELSADLFAIFRKASWSYNHIGMAFSIWLLYVVFNLIFLNNRYIEYRPWISQPVAFSFYIFFSFLMVAVPFVICRRDSSLPLIYLPSIRKIFREFVNSLVIVILVNIIVILFTLLLVLLVKTTPEKTHFFRWAQFAPNSTILLVFLILSFTLSPVVEEIFFRGFLYNALKIKISLIAAIIVQALFFSIVHFYDLVTSFSVFLIGIALAVAYEYRKTLLVPIFVHALRNALIAIPLLFVAFQNCHSPAKSWDEAKNQPDWITSEKFQYIELKKSGDAQFEYVVDKWGINGSKRWKIQTNGFRAVCKWFPNDREACAKAKCEIAAAYFKYFRDYRRSIVEADNVLDEFPDLKEQCATALTFKGWSFYRLKDFEKSKKAFRLVAEKYSEFSQAAESSQKGLKWIKVVADK